MDLLKNKRFIWIVLASTFVVLVFLVKNDFFYSSWSKKSTGLVVSKEKIVDIINKDTDSDGVPDWEEKLWGTDPNKIDTDGDGVSDSTEVSRLEKQKSLESGMSGEDDTNLNNTEKFARELFSTVAALTQSGQIDQTTLDKLSVSLAGEIKNVAQKVVYKVDGITTTTDNTAKAIKAYNDKLNTLYKKYPMNGNVLDILQNSITGEDGNIDTAELAKLDPIINQTDNFINGMLKIAVPSDIKFEHLELINALEQVNENLKDMKLIDTDVVLSLSAISQYQNNTDALTAALKNLEDQMNLKLNS